MHWNDILLLQLPASHKSSSLSIALYFTIIDFTASSDVNWIGFNILLIHWTIQFRHYLHCIEYCRIKNGLKNMGDYCVTAYTPSIWEVRGYARRSSRTDLATYCRTAWITWGSFSEGKERVGSTCRSYKFYERHIHILILLPLESWNNLWWILRDHCADK